MSKDQIIASLKEKNQLLLRKIEAMEDLIGSLKVDNNFLKEKVLNLERRLKLTSEISSMPPSSDLFKPKPKTLSLREKSNKPSGGQKGHKGINLKQILNPDKIVEHKLNDCFKCGRSLKKRKVEEILKRQVFDIPEPKVEITEHRTEIKICKCGHKSAAQFPENVKAPVQYGNRVKAHAIYLMHGQFIAEDRLKILFKDIYNLEIASDTLVGAGKCLASSLASYEKEAEQKLKNAPVKHLDETSLKVNKTNYWLHVISTILGTSYRVSKSRGDIPKDLKGIIVTDHFSPYYQIKEVSQAFCNAHHLRELKCLRDIYKEKWAGKMYKLLIIASKLKDPPIERIKRLYISIIEEGLKFHNRRPLLPKGKRGGRKKRKGHNLLLRLQKRMGGVLRFLYNPDVPFTNNQAEQDIRMMKVKQKISGCFRSIHGAEIFCRLRGFFSTCRKQRKNIFEAILSAIEGRFPEFSF